MRSAPVSLALAAAVTGLLTVFVAAPDASAEECGFHVTSAGTAYWKHCTHDGSTIKVEAYGQLGAVFGPYCIAPDQVRHFPMGTTRAKLIGLC